MLLSSNNIELLGNQRLLSGVGMNKRVHQIIAQFVRLANAAAALVVKSVRLFANGRLTWQQRKCAST
jgi:hypothetical protein